MTIYLGVLPHPHIQEFCLTWGASACLWWFFAFLGNLLPPWATPTHPCAHPCLIHLCSNMPNPCSHMYSWPFGMVRKLISPPRGVWGSNHELTLVFIQMASKPSNIFSIVIYIWSIHSYMLENHNNICYWPHVCMQFLVFQLFCACFLNYRELWEFIWLLDTAMNEF